MTRFVKLFLLALLLVVAWGTRADAHASLTSSSPAADSAVGSDIGSVTLRFNEPVDFSLNGIRVFSSSGEQLETGPVHNADGSSSSAQVSVPALDPDTYVVAWSVISADSHPARGAFTFVAGGADASDTAALSQRLLEEDQASQTLGIAFGVVRFLLLASTLLAAGTLLFLIFLWPAGQESLRARRLVMTSLTVALASTAAAVPLQARYASGLPFSTILQFDVLREVLNVRYGAAQRIRLAVIFLTLAWMIALRRWQWRGRWVAVVTVLLALGVTSPSSFTGHAVTEAWPAVAVIADIIHTNAAALWVGGLVLIFAVAMREHTDDDIVPLVARFSKAAVVLIGLVIATGVYRSIREVGGISQLTASDYGQLLMLKLTAVAVLLSVATRSRTWLQRRLRSARAPMVRLRKLLAAETALAVLVVAVTAGLVNQAPSRVDATEPFGAQLNGSNALVSLTIDPVQQGPVVIHVYTQSPAGAVMDVEEITASLSLPSKNLGPLPVDLQRVSGWHYSAQGFQLPLSGTWRMDIRIRTSDVDQETLSTTFNVS
jgi:copper transport protein